MYTEDFIETKTIEKTTPLLIEYGAAETPFGISFLGFMDEDTICYINFLDIKTQNIENDIEHIQKKWPCATLKENASGAKNLSESIFTSEKPKKPIQLILQGSQFQTKVWQSLLKVPFGQTCSYADIAVNIGNPKAVRAVASAIGANEIAFLIPCHRVISKSGNLSKYRWGSHRKKEILSYEKLLLDVTE